MSVRSGQHVSRYHRRHSSRNRLTADTVQNLAYATPEYIAILHVVLMLKSAQNTVHSYHRTRETCIPTCADDDSVQIFEEKSSIYIRNSCHGYEFLVDTGVEISVIPPIAENNLTPV